MIPTLIRILVVSLICGLVNLLIKHAPFIDLVWKEVASYVLLFFYVLWIVSILLQINRLV